MSAARAVGAFQAVRRRPSKLGHRRVHREGDLVARREARLLDRLQEQLQRLGGRGDLGREPAFVAHRRGQALSCRSAFSAWKNSAPQRSPSENDAAPTGITMNSCSSSSLSACAPPLITFIIGVGSTWAFGPAQVAPQRRPAGVGGGARHRERGAQHGVGAQRRLVGRAVELEQRVVDPALVERVEPEQHLGDRARSRRRPPADALAAVAAGRRRAARAPRARRWRRPTARAARPNAPSSSQASTSTRGIAAGVEDLAGVEGFDQRHRGTMVVDPQPRSGDFPSWDAIRLSADRSGPPRPASREIRDGRRGHEPQPPVQCCGQSSASANRWTQVAPAACASATAASTKARARPRLRNSSIVSTASIWATSPWT